ncbi:MAG: LAGLIDADG family homing endonuclease [Deltaproteobacteria bacterium]|nr:LAGLIDADG family homing endonuclease [Deltaproteobacteria bacterium]
MEHVPVETFSRGTTLDPAYVTGLIEAAGSFTFSRTSKQLSVYFAVKLADRELLEALQAFFGVGRIYASGASAYYRVNRREELPRIVAHFDQYPLRSRKRETFETWKQIIEAKAQFRRPDRLALSLLTAQLRRR